MTAELIRRTTFTATEQELTQRIEALRDAGWNQLVIPITPGEEALDDWARIARAFDRTPDKPVFTPRPCWRPAPRKAAPVRRDGHGRRHRRPRQVTYRVAALRRGCTPDPDPGESPARKSPWRARCFATGDARIATRSGCPGQPRWCTTSGWRQASLLGSDAPRPSSSRTHLTKV